MRTILLISLALTGTFAQVGQANEAKKYVWDYYKNSPPLDAEAVIDILVVAKPGETFPLLNEVPKTPFDCNQFKYPGYYADTSPVSRCQVFWRCEINGNATGFLCPNSTLFNQLTLTCDYYFNVDCEGSKNFFDYANSRLYQPNQPLFDTPPKDYQGQYAGQYNTVSQAASPRSAPQPPSPSAPRSQPSSPRLVVVVASPVEATTQAEETAAPATEATEAATEAAAEPSTVPSTETAEVSGNSTAAEATTESALPSNGSQSGAASASGVGSISIVSVTEASGGEATTAAVEETTVSEQGSSEATASLQEASTEAAPAVTGGITVVIKT